VWENAGVGSGTKEDPRVITGLIVVFILSQLMALLEDGTRARVMTLGVTAMGLQRHVDLRVSPIR